MAELLLLLMIIVLWIAVIVFIGYMAAMWFHGICLAFTASIILGLLCLFLEVPFVLFGAVDWFCHVNLAQKVVELLPQILVF